MSLFLERSLEVQLLESASFNCNALKQLFSRELGQHGVHLSTRRSSDAAERWERASRVVPSASADSSARRPDLTDRSFLQLYILGNCTTESELCVNKARRALKLNQNIQILSKFICPTFVLRWTCSELFNNTKAAANKRNLIKGSLNLIDIKYSNYTRSKKPLLIVISLWVVTWNPLNQSDIIQSTFWDVILRLN